MVWYLLKRVNKRKKNPGLLVALLVRVVKSIMYLIKEKKKKKDNLGR